MPGHRLRFTAVLAALAMLALMAPAATAQTAATAHDAVPVAALGDAIGDTGATLDDVTIERVQYDRRSGQMLASGFVEYTTAAGEAVTQDFRRVAMDVTDGSAGEMSTMSSHGCEILNLDLGPIFLDLLGLQLDLSPVELNLTAVPGAGNLLGNLLCAVAGLLDGGLGLGGLVDQLLQGVTRLLNQLLRGLGGLSLA